MTPLLISLAVVSAARILRQDEELQTQSLADTAVETNSGALSELLPTLPHAAAFQLPLGLRPQPVSPRYGAVQAVDVPPESALGGGAFVGFTLALMGGVNAYKSMEAKAEADAKATELKEAGPDTRQRSDLNTFEILADNFGRSFKAQYEDLTTNPFEQAEEETGPSSIASLLKQIPARPAVSQPIDALAAEKLTAAATLAATALKQDAASVIVPKLTTYLQDTETTVRAAAAKALGDLGPVVGSDEAVVAGLLACLTQDADPYVRAPAAVALGEIRASGSEVVPALTAALQDGRPDVRWSAARALGHLGAQGAVPALEALSADASENVRAAAATAVAAIGASPGSQPEPQPPLTACEEDVAQAFMAMPVEPAAEASALLERLLEKASRTEGGFGTNIARVLRRAEFWSNQTATLLEVINVLGRFETCKQWNVRTYFSTTASDREEGDFVGMTKKRFEMAQRRDLTERVALCQNVPMMPFTNAKLAASVGLSVDDFNELTPSPSACNIVYDALAQSRNSLLPYADIDKRAAGFFTAEGALNELEFTFGHQKARFAIVVAWFLFGKGNFVWVVVGAKFLHDARPDLFPTPQELGLFKIGAFI